jgi:hypothetical protein
MNFCLSKGGRFFVTAALGMLGSGPKWGSDLNCTAPHPRSSPVWGPVQKNPLKLVGSGLGFALGQTCSGPGPNWTAPWTFTFREFKICATKLYSDL